MSIAAIAGSFQRPRPGTIIFAVSSGRAQILISSAAACEAEPAKMHARVSAMWSIAFSETGGGNFRVFEINPASWAVAEMAMRFAPLHLVRASANFAWSPGALDVVPRSSAL
uniref:Uncharacterized protein n=1 Tax=Agrobacterium tumefaciens TaxID=358 RepID=A0A2Z2PWV3_AGRTU|nr:hypothetical protein [Agrobacterium radiobacter]ASK46940.1 hypothetical protein [Agrobacterium radiobacter]